ncbi:MAG: hypothetical protein L3J46_07390 [Kangiellaceae bacterium]|nr:hypothetical protein [Kangiellaceae bacterium]
MVDDTIPTETQSLFRALSERRVPQIAGFYMGASWGLIQFIEWIVERYGLSPLLPDFSLVILFSLLPSVLIVAYFHGKPGPDSWNLIEKISIPVNIIATITLLFSLFSGKDLGAATKTMLVENEHGDMVEHVVEKVVFRKKIIFFDFKNNTGNIEYDWLEEGVPFSIAIDLMQDPFVSELSSLVSNGALLNKSKKQVFQTLLIYLFH